MNKETTAEQKLYLKIAKALRQLKENCFMNQ